MRPDSLDNVYQVGLEFKRSSLSTSIRLPFSDADCDFLRL
ncbi:MAG: hypothetical protein AVDCRST_MAG86-1657 [uncultured Truepera sp.]|uniref:Uncharacterized protein n=1 Tax=uncultured Truepera sp. TaxID=543023 RepID=A0A6J4V884_9DEIN|nr:MAG: hypothetical protein AVDCRST_MAG86-1657 [uncultured Truepera sp.]